MEKQDCDVKELIEPVLLASELYVSKNFLEGQKVATENDVKCVEELKKFTRRL